MKILIDERLPTKLKFLFQDAGYEVLTVRDMKWLGTKNGSLPDQCILIILMYYIIKTYLKPHLFVYILECIIGLCICYTLYKYFPQHQFFWSIVSVVLVIAPDGNGSNTLAFDRMKANILGSSIGLLMFMVHKPNLIFISLALVLTILTGIFLKLNAALRPALAALVIVMIAEKQQNSTWHIAIERMGCVMFGCLTGLLITMFFNWTVPMVKNMLNE